VLSKKTVVALKKEALSKKKMKTSAVVLKQGRKSLKKGDGLKQGAKKKAIDLKRGVPDAENVADVSLKKAVLTSKKSSKTKTKSLKQAGVVVAECW
jgi:hypothetical protein